MIIIKAGEQIYIHLLCEGELADLNWTNQEKKKKSSSNSSQTDIQKLKGNCARKCARREEGIAFVLLEIRREKGKGTQNLAQLLILSDTMSFFL